MVVWYNGLRDAGGRESFQNKEGRIADQDCQGLNIDSVLRVRESVGKGVHGQVTEEEP